MSKTKIRLWRGGIGLPAAGRGVRENDKNIYRYNEKLKRRYLRKNMTRAEKILWQEIRNKKILRQRFLRQYSIGKYVVDFFCPKIKLAIEIDGSTHTKDDEIEYDIQRQKEIESLEIKFLRFTNLEIFYSLSNVPNIIKEKIQKLKDV